MTLYRALRPLLFSLPAESVHTLTSRALEASQGTPIEDALSRRYVVDDRRLQVEVLDNRFPNPVGVAAGFDKAGRLPSVLASLGFGHVEIGGVTGEPQAGNPRPRMFRLAEDEAIINRMGFNNPGAAGVARNLATGPIPSVPLGINIGKSKSVPLEEAADDYLTTYERLAPYGDFIVVNVSSPNTPGLRDLQAREPLERIITTLQEAGADPLLVKLSPDLADSAIEEAIELAHDVELAGIIATNTTTDRPDSLRSPSRSEEGGLSGRPLTARSTDVVRFVAGRTDLPVVGVGGIFTAEDAYRKLRAGASLVQLYTGLVYRGPSIARNINEGLLERLERDGFETVSDAIGADL